MNHTPAPWLYARVNDTTEAIVTDEGDSICDVRGASPADLRLLSAAPDLLAALQLITDGCTRVIGQDSCGHDMVKIRHAAIERARAAITKATQ